jgi:tRNA (guanine-N7-)-methyltransferase
VVSHPGQPALSEGESPAVPELPPVIADAEQLGGEGLLQAIGPAPRVLEIGFGRGELLLACAAEQPQRRFVGVERSRKRVAKMARHVLRAKLENVRLICSTIEPLLERALPDASIAECWVHCPDPWPKNRHHRRRFFQTESVAWLVRVLEPGALLLVSTDHLEYAQWIARALGAAAELENLCSPEPWAAERPAQRPPTGYETEWLAEGRSIAYFSYRRK